MCCRCTGRPVTPLLGNRGGLKLERWGRRSRVTSGHVKETSRTTSWESGAPKPTPSSLQAGEASFGASVPPTAPGAAGGQASSATFRPAGAAPALDSVLPNLDLRQARWARLRKAAGDGEPCGTYGGAPTTAPCSPAHTADKEPHQQEPRSLQVLTTWTEQQQNMAQPGAG